MLELAARALLRRERMLEAGMKVVDLAPASAVGGSRPPWDGKVLRLEDVGGAIAVCTTTGDLVGATPAGRALLTQLGVVVDPLPQRLPESLWQQIVLAPIAEATQWMPPGRPDERLGCTRYALGRTHSLLLMREVAGKQREMSRLLHGQRLESMGQLVSAIAHDLRTPLSAILYGAESLDTADPSLDREQAVSTIREIRAAAETLRRTVDGILDYARLGPRVSEAVSVGEVVWRAQALVHSMLHERRQTMTIAMDPRAQWVQGNALCIEQILVDLLVNASEACPSGSMILVESSVGAPPRGAKDLAVHLRVIDDGPGIAAGIGDRVFEPFFTTKTGGTGLGLTTAREAARSQSGDLFMIPSSKGACFVLVLPQPATIGKAVGT